MVSSGSGGRHKNIQLMLEFVSAPFLILHFSCYTFMIFRMMLSIILLSMLMILLYSKCDKASYLWQQLELASELESDLQDTMGWDRKWLVLEKLSLFQLAGLTTLVLLMWKWMDLLMRKNNLLRCWRWLSLLNWIGALTSSPLQKLLPRKLELWFVLWSFSLLMLLCISVNLPYSWSSSCYLEVVDELQKRICRTASPYLMHLLNTWLTIKM